MPEGQSAPRQRYVSDTAHTLEAIVAEAHLAMLWVVLVRVGHWGMWDTDNGNNSLNLASFITS